MWEKVKDLGSTIIGLIFLIGIFLLAGLFIYGGVWLSAKLYPWLVLIAFVALAICLLVLLPMTLIPRTRVLAGAGFTWASLIFGATLWTWSMLLAFIIWGWTGIFVGLFLFGVGVVPVAMLATLINGLWSHLLQLFLLTGLTFGTRGLGHYLTEVYPRKLQMKEFEQQLAEWQEKD